MIDREALVKEQDKAAKESVLRMEKTGEALVTDSKQIISSFATYPIIDTLWWVESRTVLASRTPSTNCNSEAAV